MGLGSTRGGGTDSHQLATPTATRKGGTEGHMGGAGVQYRLRE
jgi:hypothetical protein